MRNGSETDTARLSTTASSGGPEVLGPLRPLLAPQTGSCPLASSSPGSSLALPSHPSATSSAPSRLTLLIFSPLDLAYSRSLFLP